MVLGFDLGGTQTRMALADNGVLGEVITIPTDRSAAGFGRFLGALQEVAGGHKISAVGGGAPLQLEGDDGEIVVATNLPEWLGLPFRKGILDLFDCPVYTTNDMAVCGLGEAHFGAGITKGVMTYYTVSTGINAARFVDGVVDATIERYEMGYQIVDHDGKAGLSLESLGGGASVEKRFGKPPREVKDKAFWASAERYLAAGMYNTMLYWDPSVIVLGGSMLKDIDLDRVTKVMQLMPDVHGRWPELRHAKHGDAGVYGAVVWLGQKGHK
jgi:predicted NBD/HSP70 family sugar kinase